MSEELDVPSIMPLYVSGRLPVADGPLRGPTGAPDGFGVTFGAYTLARGPHDGDDSLFATHYRYDAASTEGGWLSMSLERRGFAFAVDMLVGGGSVSGTAMATSGTGNPGPFPLDGGTFELGGTLRFGARLPLGAVALEGGSGIGGDMWIGGGQVHQPDVLNDAFVANPGLDGSWYLPVWASLVYKPSCSWGVQVLASYDLYPSDTAQDAPAFAAGVEWQPSAACSAPAGLAVR
jgi:hypothetical protein